MTDAPEQIWAWPERDDALSDQIDNYGWVYGHWDRSQPECGLGVEYVRADIHEAEVAARVAKLAEGE
jgi:hypothetical protein